MKDKNSSKGVENNSKGSSYCSPEAWIGWGFLYGLFICAGISVAGSIHWPNSKLCVGSDINSTANYPNPSCADTTRFGDDQGSNWYFWRLPITTWYSQVSAWILYVTHQLLMWGFQYTAQRKYSSDFGGRIVDEKTGVRVPKYSPTMRKVNWNCLAVNMLFQVLHVVHTHLFYDALAPSVHEMSSQGSVIMMLIIIVMMETDRRGLFFGESFPMRLNAMDVAKRYHGYILSWAVTYTFWYHPCENYLGHLFGFFHVWIVLLQGSLMYTTAHLNRYWRTLCEGWVFLHGLVISYQTLSSNSWPMFAFGFGLICAVTQLPGLPFLHKCHPAVRAVPLLLLLIAYVLVCVFVDGFTNYWVIAFIPSAIWLGAIGLNLIMALLLLCMEDKCCKSEDVTVDPSKSCKRSAAWTVFFVICMGLIIAASIVAENALHQSFLNETTNVTKHVHSHDHPAAAIVVYVTMIIFTVASMLVMMKALPRPTGRPQRRKEWTTCCGTQCCCCIKIKEKELKKEYANDLDEDITEKENTKNESK